METRSSRRGRDGLGGPAITPHGRRNGSASSSRSGVNDDDFVHDDNARTPSQSTKHTPKHSYAAAAIRGSASRSKQPVSTREGGDNPKGRPDGQAPIANDVSGVKTNDDKQQVDDQAWTTSKLSPPSLLDRASSLASSIRASVGGGSGVADSTEKPKVEPDASANGSERGAMKPTKKAIDSTVDAAKLQEEAKREAAFRAQTEMLQQRIKDLESERDCRRNAEFLKKAGGEAARARQIPPKVYEPSDDEEDEEDSVSGGTRSGPSVCSLRSIAEPNPEEYSAGALTMCALQGCEEPVHIGPDGKAKRFCSYEHHLKASYAHQQLAPEMKTRKYSSLGGGSLSTDELILLHQASPMSKAREVNDKIKARLKDSMHEVCKIREDDSTSRVRRLESHEIKAMRTEGMHPVCRALLRPADGRERV